jgi:hypothetical protein
MVDFLTDIDFDLTKINLLKTNLNKCLTGKTKDV